MVTGLSVLTSLEKLIIEFESPRSHPDRKKRHPPPQARTVLPVLTQLQFFGFDEYLEDLVAQIDAPLLDQLAIIFFHQLIFDTPQWQLAQFISRTPKLKIHDEALVFFTDSRVWVSLSQPFDGWLCLGISCRQSDWKLSSLAQLCGSRFFQAVIVPAVEHLYIIEGRFFEPHWQDDIENSQWLELLHQFTAVKGLHIPGIHATYGTCPSRAYQGKRDRGVTRPADSFLGGGTPVRTCPAIHWAVRCRTTASWSTGCRLSLAKVA
jgi:hypothetical protein